MLSVHNKTPLTKHSYYRRPQFYVQDNHPIYGSRPYTQQSRGCGQPGDYIGLPFNFLTTWNNTWENFGDPAKLFVKEWAKLRYGTFDELGFEGKIAIKFLITSSLLGIHNIHRFIVFQTLFQLRSFKYLVTR